MTYTPLHPSLRTVGRALLRFALLLAVALLPFLLVVVALSASAQAQTLLETLVSPNGEDGGRFGVAVAGISDTNGNGSGDVLVGAYLEDASGGVETAGRAYLFDGATGALRFELDSPNAITFGLFGATVSGVPDTNNDGVEDLLVGAFQDYPGGPIGFPGAVYLYSGTNGALLRTFLSPNSEQGGQFGFNVSGVPDVNGDGRGDVLIGAVEEDPGTSPEGAGRAYLFSGANGALLSTFSSPNEEVDGSFGQNVGGVPDVTGDGRGDVVITSLREDPGASPENAGRAYVYNGATGTLLYTLTSPNEEVDGGFGLRAEGLADVNGDGRGDIAISARFEDPGSSPENAGRVYVFSGSNGNLLYSLASPNEEANGIFGQRISSVPDKDSDGRPELLVGASQESFAGKPDAGRAYLFSGGSGTLIETLVSPAPQDSSNFGFSLAGVPDVNGDGRGDFVVGEWRASSLFSAEEGRTHLFTTSGTGVPNPRVYLTATTDRFLSPISVQQGGSFEVDYTIANASASAVMGDLWVVARRGGTTVATLGPIRSGTIPAGQTIPGSFSQQIPSNAATGDYTYTVNVGRFPSAVIDAVTYPIFVVPPFLAAADASEAVTEWRTFGATPWETDEATASATDVAAPGTAVAYPNPFAERTRIAFSLDAPAEVRLAVYDVLGREVAVLTDGLTAAGRHEATFDAAGLPSGTYLWRLEAGNAVETGRLTLLR